jgi:hypothetical protein
VEVKLNIQGAPEGGVEHLAHIHEGATCADDRNDRGGPVEFPLESVQTTDDGTGSSTTVLEGITVDQLFDSSKERYVNVHDKAEGAGVPPGIACADLTSTAGGAAPLARILPASTPLAADRMLPSSRRAGKLRPRCCSLLESPWCWGS